MSANTCPKCGGLASVKYDRNIDRLRYTCAACNYVWLRLPLDNDGTEKDRHA